MQPRHERYTAVAIILHWAIALALIGNFALGAWMADAIDVAETQARAIHAFQLHKSLGLTILLLSFVRLAWRGMNPPPPLPAAMPAWEKFAAAATHWAFYLLMAALPLSGWLYVSAQWTDGKPLNVPTLWFGGFEVPHLFNAGAMTHELRQSTAALTLEAHETLAWGMAALLVLHIGAALKHHFINRDEVLGHMIPAVAVNVPRDARRTRLLALGFCAILLAAGAFSWALLHPTSASDLAVSQITVTAESNWGVDAARSEVAFSGKHAGVAFRGSFRTWQADIRFDSADLEHSRLGGRFETASAHDGVPLHDESLRQKEWFDSEKYPTASFSSTHITARDAGSYSVDGVLTIKGHALPVTLALTLKGESMNISGHFDVDRKEADLGMESDADAQYVSRAITVEVRVEAKRR